MVTYIPSNLHQIYLFCPARRCSFVIIFFSSHLMLLVQMGAVREINPTQCWKSFNYIALNHWLEAFIQNKVTIVPFVLMHFVHELSET